MLRAEDAVQLAASRTAASSGRFALAPSAARPTRTAATATLVAVALYAVVADRNLLEDATPPPMPTVAQNHATPIKVIAPEFCKDQTWPYLDGRCLRRIENPTPPPAETAPPVHQDAPPSSNAAATPAPQPSTNNAATVPAAGAAIQAPAPRPDTAKQVIDEVFPRAIRGVAASRDAPSNAAASDTPAYQRSSDAPRHRSRHWGGYYSRSFDARF